MGKGDTQRLRRARDACNGAVLVQGDQARRVLYVVAEVDVVAVFVVVELVLQLVAGLVHAFVQELLERAAGGRQSAICGAHEWGKVRLHLWCTCRPFTGGHAVRHAGCRVGNGHDQYR